MAEEATVAKKATYLHFVRLLGLGLGMALGVTAARELGRDSQSLRILLGGGVACGFVLLWAWLCLLFFRKGTDE